MAKDNRDLSTWTLAERIALGSDWQAAFDPRVAAWMIVQAAKEPPETVDANEFRRSVLQMIKRIHFPFHRRTTAARLIAMAWANLPDDAGEAEPGSVHEMLHRLHRSGFRPFAWRKITDDLDPMMG